MTNYPQDWAARVFAKAIFRAQIAVYEAIMRECETLEPGFGAIVDKELKKLEEEANK